MSGDVLAAKKAGTAGIEAVEMLELCVQCPASVLRALLDSMTAGAPAASLAQLAQRLQGALDPGGAGERGILLVYNDLLESSGACGAALRAGGLKWNGCRLLSFRVGCCLPGAQWG